MFPPNIYYYFRCHTILCVPSQTTVFLIIFFFLCLRKCQFDKKYDENSLKMRKWLRYQWKMSQMNAEWHSEYFNYIHYVKEMSMSSTEHRAFVSVSISVYSIGRLIIVNECSPCTLLKLLCEFLVRPRTQFLFTLFACAAPFHVRHYNIVFAATAENKKQKKPSSARQLINFLSRFMAGT